MWWVHNLSRRACKSAPNKWCKHAIRKGQFTEATNALHQADQSENELIAEAGFEAGGQTYVADIRSC
jgi:hypothetical protein